jgi:hypothetical protein
MLASTGDVDTAMSAQSATTSWTPLSPISSITPASRRAKLG